MFCKEAILPQRQDQSTYFWYYTKQAFSLRFFNHSPFSQDLKKYILSHYNIADRTKKNQRATDKFIVEERQKFLFMLQVKVCECDHLQPLVLKSVLIFFILCQTCSYQYIMALIYSFHNSILSNFCYKNKKNQLISNDCLIKTL